jgi:biopolymer transport protein ExbB
VWELVKSGGWMMLPIILCSIIAAAGIIAERLWTLRVSRVTPQHLLGKVWLLIKEKKLDQQKLRELRASSPLGEVLAAGLANSRHGREIMKECIQEAAARVIHEMERYMNALGTIASMAPLLGLLGTVLGMIQIFSCVHRQPDGQCFGARRRHFHGSGDHGCRSDRRHSGAVLSPLSAAPD